MIVANFSAYDLSTAKVLLIISRYTSTKHDIPLLFTLQASDTDACCIARDKRANHVSSYLPCISVYQFFYQLHRNKKSGT